MRKLNRREFLETTGSGWLLLSMGKPGLGFPVMAQQSMDYAQLDPRNLSNFTNSLLLPTEQGLLGILEPSLDFTLATKEITHELIAGATTKLWVYEVEQAGRTYINPIIKVARGNRIAATLRNELSEETIIHWHGLSVDWRNDGHPSYHAAPGGTYQYDFPILNRAATYWYHPHSHGTTGKQVNNGLAGFFIVEDDEEISLRSSLDFNFGETDIPLVIQDRRFKNDGSFEYNPNEHNLERFTGFIGEVILVNLTVNPYLDVGTRVYRFRILNGSNARPYKLAFLKGGEKIPFLLIGTDGGLLVRSYQVTEVFLSPGERLDVLVDMRSFQEGEVVFLKSLPFDPMHREHGEEGHPPSASRLGEGVEFGLLKLNVKKRLAYDRHLPAQLTTIVPIDTSGVRSPSTFELFTPSGHDHDYEQRRWYINGLTFEMDKYPVSVKRDAVDIWRITNPEMSMPHPLHIHGFLFQVLERRGSPRQNRSLTVDDQGRLATDQGWKDTILVWPGEVVHIAIDFSHQFSGEQTYVLHCHTLEHADQGMMLNYKVV